MQGFGFSGETLLDRTVTAIIPSCRRCAAHSSLPGFGAAGSDWPVSSEGNKPSPLPTDLLKCDVKARASVFIEVVVSVATTRAMNRTFAVLPMTTVP